MLYCQNKIVDRLTYCKYIASIIILFSDIFFLLPNGIFRNLCFLTQPIYMYRANSLQKLSKNQQRV